MSAASIVIDQSGLSAGVASRSRDDIVTGVAVQLSNDVDVGVRSWRWTMLARPSTSSASLSSSITPNPTFTPDVVGTYRIQLEIDGALEGQRDIRTVIVRDANGLRVPAAGEGDESNYLISGTPNADGYTPDLQALLELARAQLGGGGSSSAAGGWTAVYEGDFGAPATTDLSTGTNPTLTVDNELTEGVSDVEWTSNAGDATAAVTQASVTSFGTTNGTGLRAVWASSTANMTNTSHTAPHIWALWSDLLGYTTAPAGGTEYCVMIHITDENVAQSQDAVFVAAYNPNDGSSPSDIAGNTAKNDEKRLWAALEHDGTRPTISIREGSTDRSQTYGSRLPAGYDVVALIFRSGQMAEAAVGVYDGGWPDMDELSRVDTWLGSQAGFSAFAYLDQQERIAIGVAAAGSSSVDATIRRVQVLTR